MTTSTTTPNCAQHGDMRLQTPGTPEQAFCGTWYRCDQCSNTTLLPSAELDAQLAGQRKLRAATPSRKG